MLYARINVETNEVLEYPLTETQLRDRLVNTTLPEKITDFSLAGTQYVCVPPQEISGVPLKQTATHYVQTTSALYDEESDTWVRQYELVEVPEVSRAARTTYRMNNFKKKRKEALLNLDAKVMRNLSEVRQGVPTTDNIADLDVKAQELRDMTNIDIWTIDETTFFVV